MADPIPYCSYSTVFSEAIVLVLLTMMFMCAIVYMLAQLLRRPEWEAWVKNELYQVGISALIAGGAIAFALTSCSIAVSIAGGDPFAIAQQYLSNLFVGNIRTTLAAITQAQIMADYCGAVTLQFMSPTLGMNIAAWPQCKAISANLQMLSGLIVPIASSIYAQMVGLEVIQATAFTIILPLGILLRSFWITREAGCFMIAAAIGFFIVLPLTYVMDQMIMEGPTGIGTPAPAGAQPSICVDASTGYDRGVDYKFYLSTMPDNIYLRFLLFGTYAMPLGIPLISLSPAMLAPAAQCVAYVIPQALFLPTLNIIITIAFINSLTKFLSRNIGG